MRGAICVVVQSQPVIQHHNINSHDSYAPSYSGRGEKTCHCEREKPWARELGPRFQALYGHGRQIETLSNEVFFGPRGLHIATKPV